MYLTASYTDSFSSLGTGPSCFASSLGFLCFSLLNSITASRSGSSGSLYLCFFPSSSFFTNVRSGSAFRCISDARKSTSSLLGVTVKFWSTNMTRRAEGANSRPGDILGRCVASLGRDVLIASGSQMRTQPLCRIRPFSAASLCATSMTPSFSLMPTCLSDFSGTFRMAFFTNLESPGTNATLQTSFSPSSGSLYVAWSRMSSTSYPRLDV
mmetsp:Transcript_35585/g.65401  ORF Transcript_35585/g.65401 Transcript_35585/m.65401 type:complete len:211 (-) Transcript_35585:93-725(-)